MTYVALLGVLVFSFFFFLCSVVFLSFLFVSLFLDAPFIPTRKAVLETIDKALAINDKSVLYELGCGDGRVLEYCLANHSGAHGVGVEINFLPYILAKWRLRNSNGNVVFKNILTVNLQEATHIYLYLFPLIVEKVKKKIYTECKKGTRIVSCDFPFKDIEPDEVIEIKNSHRKLGKKLYVYTIK